MERTYPADMAYPVAAKCEICAAETVERLGQWQDKHYIRPVVAAVPGDGNYLLGYYYPWLAGHQVCSACGRALMTYRDEVFTRTRILEMTPFAPCACGHLRSDHGDAGLGCHPAPGAMGVTQWLPDWPNYCGCAGFEAD